MNFAQSILDLFSFAMQIAYDFLTKDMQQFAPHVARVMEVINNGLQAFSYALLVILTLWNVVKTTSSYTELKRPEVAVKLFIRFVLTKYAIGAAWSLVNNIFVISGALTSAVFRFSGMTDGNVWAGMTVPEFGDDGILGIISDVASFLNPLSQIPGLVLGLIGFIVAIVLSVTLILTVVGRFFKIYMYAALAPIPLSSFGSESTQSMGQNFLKACVAISVEGLVIAIAMIVFAAYSEAPLITFDGLGVFQWVGNAAEEITYTFTLIFNMLILLVVVKGTDQSVHKIFGV